MIVDSEKTQDIAQKIIIDIMGLTPTDIKRFTNGYCHSVFYVKCQNNEFVIRLTNKENEIYYLGSIKWLSELYRLGIPVPKILKNGQYGDIFYTIISFINGKDIGDVYHILNDFQKENIVKELVFIQGKIVNLPTQGLYGYTNSVENSFKTWTEYLNSLVERSSERIKQNGIFNTDVCVKVKAILKKYEEYFMKISPKAFLDDITTKNVLVNNGKFVGIVDIDEICYGDHFLVIGLTNMALLKMKQDTKYIDYWLDELKADIIQRKIVYFYSLLYCVDFMGEQGMQFDNGNKVLYDKNIVKQLNTIYYDLMEKIK